MRRPSAARNLAHSAIVAQARRRSPFGVPEFFIEWGETEVGLWSWDAAVLAGPDGKKGLAAPESVFFAPMEDGARLIALGDGFEGQVWREGALVASRWWAHEPARADLNAFIRAGGGKLDGQAPLELVLSEDLFTERSFAGWTPARLAGIMRPAHYAALGLVLLGAPLAYQGAQLFELRRQTNSLEARLEQAIASASQSDEARMQALGAVQRTREWSAILAGDIVAPALLELERAQGAIGDAVLERITIEGDELRITLGGAEGLDTAALVQTLEASGLLRDVAAAPGLRPSLLQVTSRLELADLDAQADPQTPPGGHGGAR